MPKVDPENIALSFKQLGVSSLFPPKSILSNVSGYVVKGGITAIMGASASGKSVLMKVLAGRLPLLHISGEITLEGKPMDPTNLANDLAYVPQDDFLMGELTPKETLLNVYSMKRDQPEQHALREVDNLLKKFGLDHVANNPIGTIFKRGLSGGQRKRVEVCSELVAPPSVLLLDEPTSGLDGAIAYDVLYAMKQILADRGGDLSLIISIHQPNSRILELFDHIMLVGGGGMIFFGTLPEAKTYFSEIGFDAPEAYTPTDVFLQVSDANFGENHDFDFEGSFACHSLASRLSQLLDDVKRLGMNRALRAEAEQAGSRHSSTSDWKEVRVRPQSATGTEPDLGGVENKYEMISREPSARLTNLSTSRSLSMFWKQYWTLLYRDFTLAYRDPSLYYLQFFLVALFGFMVGAAFFRLKPKIDSRINDIPAGLLWIVMMMCYIQVFKVYHLSRADHRFKHETSNKTYSILAYWLAELTATCILLISFIPGTIFAYFMMDLPGEAYGFLLFVYWMTALTAETMLNFITKLSTNATVSVVTSQGVLVILTVFGGGMFIAWDNCPIYWKWLQESSIFTQASRAAVMGAMDHLSYTCDLNSANECVDGFGRMFECDDSSPSNGVCKVSGRMVLNVLQGTAYNESKWIPFAFLVLIFGCFRLLSLFLLYVPVEKILYRLQDMYAGLSAKGILDNYLGLRRVERQLNAYIALHRKEDIEKGIGEPNMPQPICEQLDETSHCLLNPHCTGEGIQPLSHGCCLEWKDVSVILKTKGTILVDKVSGAALPGRILALMGPSGAGKTTLLNALSNRAPYARLEGEVTFGKRPFLPSDLVYVPQFDEFNPNLSVLEQIQLVGELKCRDVLEMKQRLANLLTILGLADKMSVLCRDLTSGELKRVSVGMGMVSNPNVLFLDEPTTGLDSSAAYSIVKYLSQLSKAINVVVIMTIHQPAPMVFDLLQDLYLLESGRLAYFGPLSTTKKYFQQLGYQCPAGVNPADFYLDMVNKPPQNEDGSPTTWTKIYFSTTFQSNFNKLMTMTISHSTAANEPLRPPSSIKRFEILIEFFAKYYYRETGIYWLRTVFLVIVALFLGTLFLQLVPNTNNISQYSGAIFFAIWTTLFSAVAATGLLAADRRLAVEQVKNAVITPFVYCLAQFVVSIPFNIIAAVAFQGIFHWMIKLNPDGESFVYGIFISMGHLLLMEAFMLSVVAALKNAMLSVTFAMVILGYLFLFSGFFIAVDNMPPSIQWVCYIAPTKYSFFGYLWQIYSNQNFHVMGTSYDIPGKTLLDEMYQIKDVDSWGMFGALLAWIVLIRLIHYALFVFDVYPYLQS